jgi:acyl-CoA thioesterase
VSTAFDRDTAVHRRPSGEPSADGLHASASDAPLAAAVTAAQVSALFDAEVSADWRAGRGPHGGYLAAMLLRALTETVADPERAPRSLTIHYARAPAPEPVTIHTVVERAGRSLSTLSARMEQDGKLIALALSAFSVPWRAQEIVEPTMPTVEPAEPRSDPPRPPHPLAPPFTHQMEFQPRLGTAPFTGADAPMEIGGWLALVEPRPLDALALAFFSDALFSPPFIRLRERATTPTIDLTIHFREPLPRTAGSALHAADLERGAADPEARAADPDSDGRCFARFHSTLVHQGFFEEDGVIWAADGTVLAQSRQLAIVLALE